MAQFDVHPNPNVAQRPAFPFVVVVQSDQLDQHTTRLVMPLARLPRPPAALPRRLSQPVTVQSEALYPAAHLCGALPARLLRQPVANLKGQSQGIVDALDAVISGL